MILRKGPCLLLPQADVQRRRLPPLHVDLGDVGPEAGLADFNRVRPFGEIDHEAARGQRLLVQLVVVDDVGVPLPGLFVVEVTTDHETAASAQLVGLLSADGAVGNVGVLDDRPDLLAPLLLVVLIAALSCTGLGLVNAALSLRIRENAVLSNVIFGFLLIFTGANVPLDDLPNWMSTLAQGLPFTHAIKAARELVAGASLGDVAGLLGAALLVGAVYGILGYALLRWFETLSRRHASLERS